MGNNTVLLISLVDVSWQPAPELTPWEQRIKPSPANALRGTVFFSKLCYARLKKKKQRKGKQRDYLLQALFKCISFSRLESTVEGCSSQ